MTAREQIFSSIKSALDVLPQRAPRPAVPPGVADAMWLDGEKDNVALFKKRATLVGTVCFDSVEDCLAWIAAQRPAKIYACAGLTALSASLQEFGGCTGSYSREDVDVVDLAITTAAGAIAETGTIILTDDCTPDRLAALAPWTHIAVVRKETIHRSIADALAALPEDPNVIWVTGPSKTADVEGILIQGVHGPGIQGCLLV